MALPEHCQLCKAYQTAKSWCIKPKRDYRSLSELKAPNAPGILVVGQAPGFYEDEQAVPFVGSSGAFVQTYLDRLDVKWQATNSIRCYPGKRPDGTGDNEPTPDQIDCCSIYMREELEQFKPGVIICLGGTAMKAILGKGAPKGVARARGYIHESEMGIPVLVGFHPVMHVTKRMDLFEDYIRMFTMAEKIVQGDYKPEVIEFETVSEEDEAIRFISRIPNRIWLDVENNVIQDDPKRCTIWHPDFKLLSCAVDYIEKGQYKTVVFDERALTAQMFYYLLKDRHCTCHNTKYDLQCIWIATKGEVDPFRLLKAVA